jgi:hypothetical protein
MGASVAESSRGSPATRPAEQAAGRAAEGCAWLPGPCAYLSRVKARMIANASEPAASSAATPPMTA